MEEFPLLLRLEDAKVWLLLGKVGKEVAKTPEVIPQLLVVQLRPTQVERGQVDDEL